MVIPLHTLNESFDLLVNGSIIGAAANSYEIAWTFGGVIWIWPIIFLLTLSMVAIKTENPTMVAIYALLGNVALGVLIPPLANKMFFFIAVFSILIFFISIFVSKRFG